MDRLLTLKHTQSESPQLHKAKSSMASSPTVKTNQTKLASMLFSGPTLDGHRRSIIGIPNEFGHPPINFNEGNEKKKKVDWSLISQMSIFNP